MVSLSYRVGSRIRLLDYRLKTGKLKTDSLEELRFGKLLYFHVKYSQTFLI